MQRERPHRTHDTDFFTLERPDFGPTQVRGLEELHPGQLLVKRGVLYQGSEETGYTPTSRPLQTELKIIGHPFQDIQGKWKVAIEYSGNGYKTTIFLSDRGVVSPKSGLWHRTNWLEDPSKAASNSK